MKLSKRIRLLPRHRGRQPLLHHASYYDLKSSKLRPEVRSAEGRSNHPSNHPNSDRWCEAPKEGAITLKSSKLRPEVRSAEGRDHLQRQDSDRTSSVEQAQGHHETEIRRRIRPAFRFERRRALRSLEREPHFLGGDVLQDLQEIVRVETDVEGIPR